MPSKNILSLRKPALLTTIVLLSLATATQGQKTGESKLNVKDTIPGSVEAADVRALIEKSRYSNLFRRMPHYK